MADRVATLIHHITTLCEPDQLGRTRIAKILWLADIERYRRTGTTITQSDNYVKDQFGPRHRDLYSAISTLKQENKIVERSGFTPVGERREYVPLNLADLSGFSADEIAIVDRITAAVIKMSAKEASNLTHDELWDSAAFNERIPVAAAAPIAGTLTPEIIAWAESTLDADSPAG
jgi:uncharacterized phage-associated protein